MAEINVVRELDRLVAEQMLGLQGYLCGGACKDYPSYREAVGKYTAYESIKSTSRQLLDNALGGDDE